MEKRTSPLRTKRVVHSNISGKKRQAGREAPIRSATTGHYHHLNDTLSRILYVILRLGRDAIQELRQGGPVPAITQKVIAQTLGGLPPYKLSRDLAILERAGYIITGEIHEARVKKGEARKIYELNSEKCICCRGTAMMLLELLNIAKDGKEAEVEIEKFLKHLFTSPEDGGAPRTCLAPDDITGTMLKKPEKDKLHYLPYAGKLQELVDSGKHVERSSARHIRPRMKIFLEQKYLRLLALYPPAKDVKDIQI